jgi:hypothetical protein
MPKESQSALNPADILREADAFTEKAAAAIDQLLAQRKAALDAVQARVAEFDAQIRRLNELYRSSTGRYYVPPPEAAEETSPPTEKTRRPRRSKSDLEACAKQIVAFIAAKGADGASGAEIKAAFPDVAGSIRDFVHKYAGVALADNGEAKRALRYLPPK